MLLIPLSGEGLQFLNSELQGTLLDLLLFIRERGGIIEVVEAVPNVVDVSNNSIKNSYHIYLFIIKRKNNSYIMTMLRVDEILEITEHQILRRVTSFAKMTATQLMSMLYYVWTPQGKSWEIIHPSCSMRRARSIGTP